MIITENSNDIYVGSTIQTLKVRLTLHESKYRTGFYCSSQEILKQGDYKIVLIKNYPCSSLTELEREETKYQRDMECVNIRLARRSKAEYYNDNREVMCNYHKEYRIENREAIRNKQNVKFTCDCGGKYSRANKSRHLKSIKHQKFLKVG